MADGPQIEANLQYVTSNFKSSFGTPYKVVRIPMPPDSNGAYPDQDGDYRTYANAVFVNKTVLVPFYEQQFDTTARRIWQENLPGYQIVGIDCNSIINLSGAIHCITKEIGVADPLRIVHQELPCMKNAEWPDGYPIWVDVAHRSGLASAKIYYTTDTTIAWQSVDLPYYPRTTPPGATKALFPSKPREAPSIITFRRPPILAKRSFAPYPPRKAGGRSACPSPWPRRGALWLICGIFIPTRPLPSPAYR